MHAAILYLLKVQHEDGTIDLLATNFHSPPDTAFVLETLCAALTILQNERWLAHDAHRADLRRFIVRATQSSVGRLGCARPGQRAVS
jgi:hypothetical protein